MKRRISVLLVDDHRLVRNGFRRILEDEPEIVVSGEAGDGSEAVRLAHELHPNVVMMDYALPVMNGILATTRILQEVPTTRVLMLSMHSEESCVRRALDAGAHGYLLKNVLDIDLVSAVRRVAAGETVLDPNLALSGSSERGVGLTVREIEVLQLIAEGQSNKEISKRLGVSVNTVIAHRANIMKGLGIHKTAQLVSYAIRRGLVTLS